MSQQVIQTTYAQQVMQYAGVGQIHLGGFHLSFAKVGMPGRQAKSHKGPLQDIQVARHSFVAHTQRTRQLTSIPGLPVIVGEHGPEATQGDCGKVDTQLWQIAFEIGAYESVTPFATSSQIGLQQCAREPPTQPASIYPVSA